MRTLHYKGYIGSVDFSEVDNCLFGKVMGLPSNIALTYEGSTVGELKEDFMASVDEYLDDCKERGVTPQKTYSGSFNIRIPQELHGKIAALAAAKGETINAFVRQSLELAVK